MSPDLTLSHTHTCKTFIHVHVNTYTTTAEQTHTHTPPTDAAGASHVVIYFTVRRTELVLSTVLL